MGETIQIALPSRPALKISERAFWRLCLANPDLRMGRTSKGELWVMAPACLDSGMRNAGFTAQLWNWNHVHGLGVVFDSSTGYTLPNGLIHAPDASWIVQVRWDALEPRLRKKFAPICPDFVAELTSPSDKVWEVRARLREFIDQGSRLGWLLDTKRGRAEIHRPDRPVETLDRPATLSGEDVLPGFVLDLKGILFD